MFALRCIDISLTFFVTVYCMLSLLVTRSWRPLARLARGSSPRRTANLLFALRIAPLLLALAVTAIFVLPSFLLLEPRAAAEPVGETPLALSICCVVLVAIGLYSAIRAQVRISRALSICLQGATPEASGNPVPLYRIRPAVPALTLAGVCTPRVLLSDAAASLLSEQELRTALAHELAHVRHRDNLKKLLFRCTVFPGMSGLETAWSEAGEMAADDAAVSNASDALDLASALIKLSRLGPASADPRLMTALVSGSSASLHARVERLVTWQHVEDLGETNVPWYVLPAAVAMFGAMAVSYSAVLIDMHRVTEWLVR